MPRLTRILAVLVLGVNAVLGQTGAGSEILPGNNLVVDGIPKIPSSLAKSVGL